MFDIPTIIEAPSGGAAESSPAEASTETSQEAQTSTPSGETQTTQDGSTETAAPDASVTKADATQEGDAEKSAVAADQSDAEVTRFDQHPRWKAMLTQRNDAREQAKALALEKAQLEGRLSALESMAQPKHPQERGIDFDAELAKIDAQFESGEISQVQARAMERKLNNAMLQQQLKSFQGQLAEQMTAKESKAAEQAKVAELTNQFIKANPDFVSLRDSGELDDLLQQDPLHDFVSAYYALKNQKAEAAHKAELEAAVKSAEERVRKEFTTKQAAKTMQASTAAPPAASGAIAPELKDPKKYGGVAAVLARRLEQRMAAANK